jgi:preprotein translocase subunit SecG
MLVALRWVQFIVGVLLIVLILLQSKGSGLGTVFGGENSVFRTRRGVEKLLFNFTIYVSAAFLFVSLLVVSKFVV